jgi:hypothetical protein
MARLIHDGLRGAGKPPDPPAVRATPVVDRAPGRPSEPPPGDDKNKK